MLEKLATHDVETVTTLFTLADKCAWHLAPQTGVTQTGGSGATMALGATDQSYPDGRLRCHHPGRWQEKEEELRSR
jgi:hypothetical protein